VAGETRSSFDARSRSAERSEPGDLEGAAALLRARLRGGEASQPAVELRALAGEGVAQLALGGKVPPRDLAQWVEAWAEVDRRAWICGPLVAAGLCVERLSSWPAGEGTARILGLALIEVAGAAVDARESAGSGSLDPRRAAERALAAAGDDMDELRQLMESIQAEHGLSVLRAPRALACGLAAVEGIRCTLHARRGLRAAPGQAVAECAEALDDSGSLRVALEGALVAAAARLERQGLLDPRRSSSGPSQL